MKAIPFVFVFAAVFLLSCVGQQPAQPGTTGLVYFSITDKQLDMANVTSVDVTIAKIELHKTGAEALKCALSLCGCKCYPEGQTPEELNGTLCGINCLGEFNITGCKVVDNACTEVYTGENQSETNEGETNETETDETEENASDNADSWVTILNESKTYDLLALTNVKELLTSANVEAGSYNIIRLQISNVSVVMNGQTQEAKLPSSKIDIEVRFTVTANSTSLVGLDFNLNDSLHITGDGKIIMAPVIKVEVDRGVKVEVKDGEVKKTGGERETETEVGMDEHGNVGEGKRINETKDLEIGGNGAITEKEVREHTQYDVSAKVNGFTPATITISVGDTIRWIFRDSFSHRLVSDTAGFDSMARYQDQVWTYTFNQPGTFAYHDSLNPNAQGTVIVKQ